MVLVFKQILSRDKEVVLHPVIRSLADTLETKWGYSKDVVGLLSLDEDELVHLSDVACFISDWSDLELSVILIKEGDFDISPVLLKSSQD